MHVESQIITWLQSQESNYEMDVESFCNYLESSFQQPEILSMFTIYHHKSSVVICNIYPEDSRIREAILRNEDRSMPFISQWTHARDELRPDSSTELNHFQSVQIEQRLLCPAAGMFSP